VLKSGAQNEFPARWREFSLQPAKTD